MKIEEILETEVTVSFDYIKEYDDLINHYVLFSGARKIVGEITSVKKNTLIIRLVGEIIDNVFSLGVTNKPSINAEIELIGPEATSIITSYPDEKDSLYIGHSAIFSESNIYMNVTKFFNSHFSIIGGTGSGKSFSLSRIVQTLFETKEKAPLNASLFIFDTYGEYYPSFLNLEQNNPDIAFKNYTTNPNSDGELLRIPPHLLGVDDLAILLNAEEPQQLQVLEKH